MEDCCLLSGLKGLRRCCPRKARKFFKTAKTALVNAVRRGKNQNKEKKVSSSTEKARGRPRKRTKRTANEREESSPCRRRMEMKKHPGTRTGSSQQEKTSQDLRQQEKKEAEEQLEECRMGMAPIKGHRSMEESSGTVKKIRSPLPTSVLGFYFHSVLGKGGFGTVMLASVSGKDSPVAVKIIRKKAIQTKYILKERRTLEVARNSPFLCHGFAAFQTLTCALFVMEYVAGGSLESYMKRVGCFTETTAAHYSAELVCGVQFLHAQGIIHRDLKPDNILLDGEGHLKISDFGLVAEGILGTAETTGRCGTFMYMAPEVHLKQAYGVAVDWWSVGVILFRMLNGTLPFYDANCRRVMVSSMLHGHFQSAKDLSVEAVDILQKLLNKDPQNRLLTAINIRVQPFFQNINWEDIESRRAVPPYQPPPANPCLQILQKIPSVLEFSKDKSSSSSFSCSLSADSQSLNGFSFVTSDWMV